MYQVQLWNDTTHTVEYHSVPDAIDYDDAQHVIQSQYPQHTILAVIHKPPPHQSTTTFSTGFSTGITTD